MIPEYWAKAPGTPTEVHDSPCRKCPAMGPLDPEAEDILTWPREIQLQSVFACAWRTEKLCKGWCDLVGYTASEEGER